MSCQKGTALAGRIDRQRGAEESKTQQHSSRNRQHDEQRIDQPSGPEMDAACDEVQRAVEKVRSGYQDHARADRDQAKR